MDEFRVLIVDDEPDFLETIVKRLKRRKIDATGLSSGRAALELLEREHFDVVILDVRMPEMDGIETLREIKRMRPLVEVILLTGHASVESGMEGMQQGAFDYVMKPADIGDLIEKVRQACQRKSMHEHRLMKDKGVL